VPSLQLALLFARVFGCSMDEIAFNLLAARVRGKMRRDGQPPACA
jgi:hypothetical protein